MQYFFIFITGSAGLIYQVTWQKYLSRLLGSDTTATAIILAVFLGGLSLGYFLCGTLTTRVKNHFKAYALLEGIIGLWCFSFPMLFDFVESFTQYWRFSPPLMIIVQGVFCAVLLTGIPTVAMGGTVPFLTRGISRNLEEATHIHARVYAINTAGAFLGTLLAGFYLIPEFGLPLTVKGTAFLNLSAALFFYTDFWMPDTGCLPDQETRDLQGFQNLEGLQPETSIQKPAPGILYIIAFLSGFYVMALENVFIRITGFSIGSSSYTFSLVVSVFILAIAVGSYAIDRLKHIPPHLLFVNQLAITLFLLLIYISLDTWPYWAHIIRIASQSNRIGMMTYYTHIFAVLVILFILPIGCMGATVPIAFHEIKRDLKQVGKHSGMLLSFNTIGNLTGSLAGGIVLYYFFNNSGIFLTAVLLAAVSTCLAGLHLSRQHVLTGLLLLISILFFSILTPFYNQNHFAVGVFRKRTPFPYSFEGPSEFFKQFGKDYQLKFYKDDPTATVGVIEFPFDPTFNQKPRVIIINGKSDSSTTDDIYTLKFSAHIPALLAEKRKDVMVIGLGTGVTAGELTLYPDIECIDVAEISPSVIKALPYFKDVTYNAHLNPKIKIHQGDAFRIIKTSKKKWDVMISEPSNPWVTGVDLLFTQEFYKLAKAHLNENGILLQWIQAYEANEKMMESVMNTVQKEFRQCHVFIGNPNDLLIIASDKVFSASDLERAENLFNQNEQVMASLKTINITSLDAILIRQIWSPSYLSSRSQARAWERKEIETMDNPKLHYIAAKCFFTHTRVSHSTLFSPASAYALHDYLLVQKYKDWENFSFSDEALNAIRLSLQINNSGQYLPMEKSLRLKAYLSNHSQSGAWEREEISENEKLEFGTEMIPFITTGVQSERDWHKFGLGYASIRQKCEVLLSHISRFRNWIVPYSLEGLKKILRDGITKGQDVYERNWCALQLIQILLNEKSDSSVIKKILDQTVRKGTDRKIIIRKADEELLKTVEEMSSNPPNDL